MNEGPFHLFSIQTRFNQRFFRTGLRFFSERGINKYNQIMNRFLPLTYLTYWKRELNLHLFRDWPALGNGFTLGIKTHTIWPINRQIAEE